jgi:tRNA nucleotidyltransferase/poly(A) polymerase/Zn finger protein HypA/HybF involved in hydrogenase expression
MITTKELEDYYEHPTYPNGPVKAVTPFPAGVLGTQTATNQVDIYSSDAYSKWFKHVTRKASLVGYSIVQGLETNKDEKKQSLDSQKGDKKAQEEFEASLTESITLPVSVGDTILTGRFKNKKTVVKTIGKDEHGMPTINGRKVVNFRMIKEGFIAELAGTEVKCEKCNHQWEIESDDSEKYLCHSCGWDSQKQEYDFDAFDSWQEKMGLNESKNFKLRVPSDIVKLQKQFKKNGKKLYIVGGAVRDAILGKSPKDFDLATDAKPEETMKIGKDGGFKTSQDVGTGMGLGIVIVGGHEVATFRKDIGKGRRPDSVEYTDIEGDVKRRDLTINALFYDIERKEIVDLVGGIADLKKKNIRTVGNAVERFDEDPLRKLRALRFQSRMGGSLDKELLDALQKDPSLKSLPAERIRDEFVKSLKTSKDTKKYMELCDKIGFTSQILPNLKIDKPYIKTTDYIVFLSVLLKKNSPALLGKLLNKLSYTNTEKNDIVFLVSLQYFKPEEVGVYKKLQQKTSLSDNQIVDFGKSIGKDMKKFVSFKLSVGGNDVPSDIKGAEIGLWIKNKERENFLNEMPMSDLQKIDKFADKQLNPVDTVLTGKHFFDRLNDPRNGKEISQAELIGFFKRLGKKKKEFVKFLNQYNQIVVKDNRTNLNIPFMKQANKLIAKTIMRKNDFKSSDAKYTIESEELDERGKMRPADRLRRKASMAGKSKEIARRRARTMKRRKPLSKLKKIAYKMAYRQVYAEFMEELYPGIKKADLSIAQTQVVHKNVVRKKGRIMKRAKFRFLPALRDAEVQKFTKNEDSPTNAHPQGSKKLSGRTTVIEMLDVIAHKMFGPDYYKLTTKQKKEVHKEAIKGKIIKKTPFNELMIGYAGPEDMKRFDKRNKEYRKDSDSNKEYQYDTVKEGLKDSGITDFKSLFKKMPSDLQKRVYNLKNFGQRVDKHPEGNVLKHTIMVVNRSIKEDDIDIAIAAMFHDIGKDETAGIHPKKGHITHFGHEKVSASLVKKYKKFIEDVGGNTANVFYIVKNHMRYKQLSDMRPVKQDKLKSFRAFDKLGKFSKHDKGGLGESKEIENMDSIEQLISDIDNKLVEMFIPNNKTPQQLIKENINESKLLQEGGAYGHMSHPFDTDINLTFGQLKDIVNRALEGTLEFTREKTDGQALAISWRDGRLVAARNKGHLKNKGENALDIKAVADKFAGRGELEKAYNFAMKDLSDSIKSLSEKQRDKVFKQGACFMNLEVIYPTSVNVIPYGQALLVFHGTMEFNMDGIAIGENGDAARVLAGMIKQVNKDVQDNYTIQGPPVIKLPKSQNLNKSKSKYSSQISKLQKEFSLKDTDGVANYHQAWWEQWVDKNSPTSLDNKTKMGLVKRWAFMEKGFRLDKKNFSDEKTLEWAKKTDKEDQKKIGKNNLMKFEQIFLGLGAEVLEFTSSALTVNPDKAVRDMKKRIDKTIKDVKKSGDPKKIEKLKLELGRLQSIGGSKKIVPNEGIVFVYNDSTFKLTGTFASVNQILGIFF